MTFYWMPPKGCGVEGSFADFSSCFLQQKAMPVISGRCSVLTSAPAVVQLFPLRDEINDFTTDGAGVVVVYSCL